MPRKNIDARGMKICPSCMKERYVFTRLIPSKRTIRITCNKDTGCGAKSYVPDDPDMCDYYMV